MACCKGKEKKAHSFSVAAFACEVNFPTDKKMVSDPHQQNFAEIIQTLKFLQGRKFSFSPERDPICVLIINKKYKLPLKL